MDEVLLGCDFLFGLGDTIDNGTRNAPGASIFEQAIPSPKEQVIEADKVLGRLWTKYKLMHESNHSIRTYKESGFFTAEEWLAEKHGIKWGGWQALSDVIVRKGKKRESYTIHSMHGVGGGTAIQSSISAVSKQLTIADADLYVRGHHHRCAATRSVRFESEKGKVDAREILYVTAGCFLSYHDSYGEMAGYTPNSYGAAIVDFYIGEKKMRASV